MYTIDTGQCCLKLDGLKCYQTLLLRIMAKPKVRFTRIKLLPTPKPRLSTKMQYHTTNYCNTLSWYMILLVRNKYYSSDM